MSPQDRREQLVARNAAMRQQVDSLLASEWDFSKTADAGISGAAAGLAGGGAGLGSGALGGTADRHQELHETWHSPQDSKYTAAARPPPLPQAQRSDAGGTPNWSRFPAHVWPADRTRTAPTQKIFIRSANVMAGCGERTQGSHPRPTPPVRGG
ncbi:MAG: hypothetical protein M3460_03520 [Actinomycetota bacterium]|nr:hypothetical protein [Actinomycetota bacterium]